MNKLMVAASAAALLAASSLAALAAEASGTITSIDLASATVTLDDGNTYKLPADLDVASLQIGAKVKITFDEVDGEMNATMVEPEA